MPSRVYVFPYSVCKDTCYPAKSRHKYLQIWRIIVHIPAFDEEYLIKIASTAPFSATILSGEAAIRLMMEKVVYNVVIITFRILTDTHLRMRERKNATNIHNREQHTVWQTQCHHSFAERSLYGVRFHRGMTQFFVQPFLVVFAPAEIVCECPDKGILPYSGANKWIRHIRDTV